MLKLLLHFRQANKITKRHEQVLTQIDNLHADATTAEEYTKATISHLTEELGRIGAVKTNVEKLRK